MSATVSHGRVWLVRGVVVCVALLGAGTPAEISGGSILALHFTETAVVVAADSSRHTSAGEVPDRLPCKIAVLGPQLFFARTGRTHINSWTTTDEARAAFDELSRQQRENGFALAVAERWGERTKRMYERAWAAQGNRLFHGLEDNTITLGILAERKRASYSCTSSPSSLRCAARRRWNFPTPLSEPNRRPQRPSESSVICRASAA